MELIKGITQPSSFDEMTTTQEDLSFEVSSSYMNEEHLSLGLNMSNEAENDGSLKK